MAYESIRLTRLFHTRVARRVTLPLLGCAVIPVAALGWLTLQSTTEALDLQARAQLYHDVKTVAINGVDRLGILSDKLALLGAAILGGQPAEEAMRPMFDESSPDLAVDTSDGGFRTLRGRWTQPILTPEQHDRLNRSGTVVIATRDPDGAMRLVLLVRTAVAGRHVTVLSSIDEGALWGLEDDLLPPATAVCVFTGRVVMMCSSGVSDERIAALETLPGDSAGTVRDADGVALVQTRSVPLGYGYGFDSLALAMIRSQASARAPLARFVRDFWLVLSLSLLVVTLASVWHVRRSLHPLDQLVAATGRLATRDFATWIDVSTGDEFQVLGDAMNNLATELRRQFEALEAFNLGTLAALARAIDAKSPWTAGHSERVTVLAVKLGHVMGLPPEQIADLHRGGLVHDIGKLATPSEILDKPAPLTPDERRIIEEHPSCGVRILQPIAAYAPLLPMVSQHHERWDGTGYPAGLRGDAIALSARIMAVADAFDAITSARPYRAGLTAADALAIIEAQSGLQFEPAVVKAFTQMIRSAQ